MSPFLLKMITKERIEHIVNEWLRSGDYFLVEIKLSSSRIMIFIDKPSGVTIEECSSLNRYLVEALESSGIWDTHSLEVSSPGLEQPLKVFQQYQKRLGREVKIITSEGRELKGKLTAADEDGLELVETVTRKENNQKITKDILHHFNYDKIKETK